MTIKTDLDVIKLARRLDAYQDKILELVHLLDDSEHPNTQAIVDRLNDNGYPILSWATHAIHNELEHPERWTPTISTAGLKRVPKKDQ
jgi:hypothetical protein